jgi:hypothetical protein
MLPVLTVNFYNATDGKWTGPMGQRIELTVYEGLPPVAKSHQFNPGEAWAYQAKSDIKYKIKSCTLTKGWPTFEGEMKVSPRLPGAADIYIVESNHALAFNISREWPLRFPDKL